MRKNALLLFSKVPEVGLVKTRLSILKDGNFTPEDACELYKCMLLDVIDVCLAAFQRLQSANDEYRLVISTTPAENVQAMKQLLTSEGFERNIDVIFDAGSSFDEHYNDAFDKTWAKGFDYILSMGADMPALTVDDIERGFNALHSLGDAGGIVLSPDQEMGVSIIGWPRSTKFDHSGVFYNQSGLTVLPAYIKKARSLNLKAIYIPSVPDVDTMPDLAHNVTLVEALSYCDNAKTPQRTAAQLVDLGIEICVPPNNLFDPREAIDS